MTVRHISETASDNWTKELPAYCYTQLLLLGVWSACSNVVYVGLCGYVFNFIIARNIIILYINNKHYLYIFRNNKYYYRKAITHLDNCKYFKTSTLLCKLK